MFQKIYEKAIGPLTRYLMALVLFFMMVLGTVDVMGRYFFNDPVFGATEMASIGLGLLVFTALPAVSFLGEHIAVDLIPFKPGTLLTRIRDLIIKALTAAILLFLGLEIGRIAWDYTRFGDTSPALRIPLGPVAFFMAGMTVLAAVCIVFAVRKTKESNGDKQP